MTIELLSTNIGELKSVAEVKNKTGIFKAPTSGAMAVDRDGLRGDRIGSVKYHGGPDQAVYIYSAADYAWWEQTLGRALPFGIFGENLTVSSLGDNVPRIGDVWRLGGVTLQISGPRIPCATLAARLQEPTFVKDFARANKGGAYARVLATGQVEAGMTVEIEASGAEHPTIDELFAVWHLRKKDRDLLRRALASPLASRVREQFEKWVGAPL